MARKYGELKFSEKYTDKKTNEEKKIYHKMGTVFLTDDSIDWPEGLKVSIKIPLFGKWFAIYKDWPRDENGKPIQNQAGRPQPTEAPDRNNVSQQFQQRTGNPPPAQQNSFTQGVDNMGTRDPSGPPPNMNEPPLPFD